MRIFAQMSIAAMNELENEWKTAADGFPAGVSFAQWLCQRLSTATTRANSYLVMYSNTQAEMNKWFERATEQKLRGDTAFMELARVRKVLADCKSVIDMLAVGGRSISINPAEMLALSNRIAANLIPDSDVLRLGHDISTGE